MDDGRRFLSAKSKPGSFKKRSRPQFDTGKRRRSNFGGDGDASTNSKPIDTLYRILCPVKKIGSVLGKGGEIVNALREQTQAKIRVADAIPGAEDRVIIIFNYSSKQPGELDADEDLENANEQNVNEHNDMQPHCPAQDALLKVHDRVVADEYLKGGVFHEKTELDNEVTVSILVPSNQVGCLLGKGGVIIKKLRSDTGAGIRILPAEHLPPCAMDTDELVQISGVPAVVKKALYVVSTMLHEHPHKENPPLEELVYVSAHGLFRPGAMVPFPPQGNPHWSRERPGAPVTPPLPFAGHRNEPFGYGPRNPEMLEEFSMRILCATGRIGGVIGKGGVTVKQLEHQTGAKIQVEDTDPAAEERIIIVTSKEAPWDHISCTIDAVLQLQGRTSVFSEDGNVTTRLLVPSSKVGCLLGQGGNIITEMRRRTKADIRVFPKNEKPKYASHDEELVQISGNKTVAEEALFEVASRLRTRTMRPGNALVDPAPSGPFHGFAPSEKMPSVDLPPYGMMGAENSGSYGYSKFSGPRNEAQDYPVIPTGRYSAGGNHEVPSYPGPQAATGYSAGQRHDYLNYPGESTPTGSRVGQRHEYHDYPGGATGRGYGSGQRQEAQGYPGPNATGYNNGPRNENQGYPDSAAAAAYGSGGRHDAQGFPSPTAGAEYNTGTRHEAPSYPGPPTGPGYNPQLRREAQGYPGAQTSMYGDTARYDAQTYSGSQISTGYSNLSSSVEVKIPNTAVASVVGVGGVNISDIRQISGARVNINDAVPGASECVVQLSGTYEQIKAAQSLIQSFITSGRQDSQVQPEVSRRQY